MSNENEAILLEKRGKIAYITFNRPEVLNAFRPIDYYLLDDLVNDCDNDPEIRAIIFTGKGRAWSVGDDVAVAVSGEQHEKWVAQDPVQDLMWKEKNLELAMSRQLIATQKTCLTLLNSGKVSIAAVNGICYIAEYLYAMDFVVAAEHATFAQGDIKIGICPIGSSTQLAPRVLGRRRATELLLNPELIPASEAYRLGLVNKVVPAEQLMKEAETIANRSAGYSASAIKLTKMLMTKAQDNLSLQEGLEQEVLMCSLSLQSGDYKRYAEEFFSKKEKKTEQ
ncbi:MAG: enoyl-CoA hydratase/isomerase family protein [Halioglobus sp.]|nr:enoyl-CoA hydratase/isomerase family protein [Halioglobus sp.]